MNNWEIYFGISIIIISIITLFLLLRNFNSLFTQKELRLIKKIIKKDIVNSKLKQNDDYIVFKKFEILDLWQINVIGKDTIKKVEVFIRQNGKFYEYEAVWNSDIFEKNKLRGFSDSPIIMSVIRQSYCLSLLEWEETKTLGV